MMPFILVNVRATYHGITQTLLYDLMHKEVEVYVNPMIIKSKNREGHVPAL